MPAAASSENLCQGIVGTILRCKSLREIWDNAPYRAGPYHAHPLRAFRLGQHAHAPFAASHGIVLSAGHGQLRQQGALLCQEWPGAGREVAREHYFAVRTSEKNRRERWRFSCSLWRRHATSHAAQAAQQVSWEKIARARLPRGIAADDALLASALVLGHVERAWGYSFISPSGDLTGPSFLRHADGTGSPCWPGHGRQYALC